MTETKVKNYFKKWAAGKNTKESRRSFVYMLQCKAYCAVSQKRKVYAYDKERTAKELGEMLSIADDII